MTKVKRFDKSFINSTTLKLGTSVHQPIQKRQ